MLVLTNIDQRILLHLAHYKFLTLSQLVRLGTGEKTYVSSRIKVLKDAGFIGASQYGGVYVKGEFGGRVENISYLLPKGVTFLVENIHRLTKEQVQYPKGTINAVFSNDYYHRVSTINVQIAYEIWANKQGYEPLFFHTYFHKIGAAKRSKEDDPMKSITRIVLKDNTFIEPDIIGAYNNNETVKIFVCEVCNGKDTTRHVEALKRLGNAIAGGLIIAKYESDYEIKHSPRVLTIVDTEDLLRLILHRIQTEPYFTKPWMEQAFFFKVAEKVWRDFAGEWVNLNSETMTLL